MDYLTGPASLIDIVTTEEYGEICGEICGEKQCNQSKSAFEQFIGDKDKTIEIIKQSECLQNLLNQ